MRAISCLPKGKALRATKANLAQFEQQRTQLEANNLELKKEADAVAVKLNGKSFIALRQASDSGQLYGSVSTRDISDLITEGGFTVARSQILLDRPIKALGRHPVRVGLHPEVVASVTVNVARTLEEAERQARGENVNVLRDDDDDDDERPRSLPPRICSRKKPKARRTKKSERRAENLAARP